MSNESPILDCKWCCSKANQNLPRVFCWTKMQAEAGQSLNAIIARKNLEREAGSGVFMWGIGNSLRPRILDFVTNMNDPKVFFSPMRSRPKPMDVKPEVLFCWTRYSDMSGQEHMLPSHSMILSRGDTSKGIKSKHYALVCYSEAALSLERIGALDIKHCKNWGSKSMRVGASQVSAVLEHYNETCSGSTYEVTAWATLIEPYFITLSNPLVVTEATKVRIDSFVNSSPSVSEWLEFTASVKESLLEFNASFGKNGTSFRI